MITLMKEISKIHSSHHRNVSTDPLGTGGGSLEIRAAHFGDHSYKVSKYNHTFKFARFHKHITLIYQH
jgi:hypothetical protein